MPDTFSDRRRPLVHFTAECNWLNDPNGLVFAGGEYHLFYQHHPAGLAWGPMHWGHAVSADLIHWRHLPIALYPDALGFIFSGSAVADHADTAGFGAGALIAVFTHEQNGAQRQSLAYSQDQGRTWIKYAGNPVLAGRPDQPDFRDPKVFWHGDHWVMLLAAKDRVLFFTSPNLKDWTASGCFGPGQGATAGVWETPELVRLPIDGGPAARWVLLVGVQQGAPAGGCGTQYFVGDFDGRVFTSATATAPALWADYGADFYAAQAWNDAPGGRAVIIAWMSNWDYANLTPADAWRGAFSIPRELTLTQTAAGPRLVQTPLPELQRLRGASTHTHSAALEIAAEFQIETAEARGLRLRWAGGEQVSLSYSPQTQTLALDRTQSGPVAFGPGFGAVHTAPLTPVNGRVRVRVFVDRTSIEVFANDGAVCLTDQIFPAPGALSVEAFGPAPAAWEMHPLTPAEFISAAR